VVSICIFLTTNDIEYIFMCLFVTHISSLEKFLFESFPYLKIGFFYIIKMVRVCYKFWIPVPYQILISIFSQSVACLFLSWKYTLKLKRFKFSWSSVYSSPLLSHVLLVSNLYGRFLIEDHKHWVLLFWLEFCGFSSYI
jgi:hypothetical protein